MFWKVSFIYFYFELRIACSFFSSFHQERLTDKDRQQELETERVRETDRARDRDRETDRQS